MRLRYVFRVVLRLDRPSSYPRPDTAVITSSNTVMSCSTLAILIQPSGGGAPGRRSLDATRYK
jgi:hypothetical protein